MNKIFCSEVIQSRGSSTFDEDKKKPTNIETLHETQLTTNDSDP